MPDDSVNDPLSPPAAAPDPKVSDPVTPLVVEPVPKDIDPLLPDEIPPTPVLKINKPLTPFLPAFAVCSTMAPLLLADE